MRQDKIYIYKDSGGHWAWNRRAPNGKLVGRSSESYVKKSMAVKNALRCMTQAQIIE